MSILNKVMEKAVQLAPDAAPDPLIARAGALGQSLARVDGPLKVRGAAPFSAEYQLPDMAHAVLVCSTIAKGKIGALHTDEALRAPGVLAVITPGNAPAMKTPPQTKSDGSSQTNAASGLPILGDQIYYDGQPIAVVVAQTLDQAQFGAALVRAQYDEQTPDVDFENAVGGAQAPANVLGEPATIEIGDAEAALKSAGVLVDNLYRTPRHNQNAMEPHATIAHWNEDGELEVFDSSQFVTAAGQTLALIFGVKPDKVRVRAPFVGGAFGGKVSLWPGTALCVAAARVVGRPVKLALSREDTFRTVGGRTLSQQRVALAADAEGKLSALIHQGITAATAHNDFPEQFTFPARHLYAAPNISIAQEVVALDTVPNTYMRAPGDSIGTFALESAMDELAHELQIDPIELRLRNEPAQDPTKGTDFSIRNLAQAYRDGAQKFGWQFRAPRSQREGDWLIGQGVAAAYYPYYRLPGASARARILADGSAVIAAAAQEMGMGTATVQAQVSALRLGLPVEKVSFEYGDSSLPSSPMAGGSAQTASVGAAVRVAIEAAQKQLLELASQDEVSPLHGLGWEQVEARDGGLFAVGDAQTGAYRGETYAAILGRAGQEEVCAQETAAPPMEILKYSMHSWGAQFCEVRVNDVTGETRVTRWLGSFDCGKILNPQTALSQFRGGIIMGIGAALLEETIFDARRGRINNVSLAEYHVPVNLDVPEIEVIYTDVPDPLTPMGGHGIGEIGITGVAAAVANAVFNATGKRVRDLPIKLDKLL